MRTLTLLLSCLLALPAVGQDLSLFEVFTDHAVLQRDAPHPIWGWNKRGRRVNVAIDGQVVSAKTDRDGKWRTELPAMAAGGPHTIEVTDGRTTINLQDVYFGDVYLLSGQSNMEWRLAQSDPDSVRAREIADPLIRQVLVAKTAGDTPADHITLDEPWKPGTASEIADFSGVGAYFAHYLRAGGVEVPIGLVHASWGGSRIEPWLSAEVLGMEDRNEIDAQLSAADQIMEGVRDFYRQEFPGEEPPEGEDRGQELGYLDDRVDLSNWATVELPGPWEARGYTNVDGYFYYRRSFDLTAAQASGDATLYLGTIDDGDQTYLNGTQVGNTPNAYSEERKYAVPASVLRPGENTIAVRVYDGMGGGGFMSGPEALYLETVEGRVPLAGEYYYRVGQFKAGQGQPHHVPTLLYNAMIAPLQQWPLTGVLWYQGESNAGPGDAEAYADRMRTLVTFWRDRFGNAELPFYWVQLANFQDAPTTPNDPGWAILRASQTAALDLPHTGQAIITDIGEADDIHPKNKWEVGRRLSLHALRNIYGKDVQASSPVPTDLDVDDEVAEITFAETGGGLEVRDTDRYPIVKSLSVRDTEGNWHWAVGLLEPDGKTLRVVNPAGTDIAVVRYAWFNNPDDANLFSQEGLPVTPFELRAE